MKLTDDEIVALAVRTGDAWPSPLPTVDVDVAGDVAAAARRGERSLYARDLLTTDDEDLGTVDASLHALIRPAAERDVVVSLFAADRDARWHAGGPNLLWYRADSGRALVETVSEAGVHSFAVTDADIALGTCRELADAAYAGGVSLPGAQEPTETLCLSRPAADGVETLQIRRGAAQLHVNGRQVAVDERRARDWVAALA